MDHDALLEAGWPAHWALYTGRSEEEVMEEIEPIGHRLLIDAPHVPLRDVARYYELHEELGRVPRCMDEMARLEAEYNARVTELTLRNHKESR